MHDFPVSERDLRRMVGIPFSGSAKGMYEEVASNNLGASSVELWSILESKLYKESQQMGQRASFYSTSWKERTESIEQYGACLRTQALTLPDSVSEEALVHRFIEGFPQRVRQQALLISCGYDRIVARTALVSEAGSKKPEPVRRMKREGDRHGRESSGAPRDSPGAVPGGDSRPEEEGHRDRVCYPCRKLGHISRYCSQLKNKQGFVKKDGFSIKERGVRFEQ